MYQHSIHTRRSWKILCRIKHESKGLCQQYVTAILETEQESSKVCWKPTSLHWVPCSTKSRASLTSANSPFIGTANMSFIACFMLQYFPTASSALSTTVIMFSICLIDNHSGCYLSPSAISFNLCTLSQRALHFFVLVLTASTNSLMRLTSVRMVSAVPSTDSGSIFLPEPCNSFTAAIALSAAPSATIPTASPVVHRKICE